MTDVDQIVGDDAQADPALDAGQAFVATAVQAMASLEKTDTTFTASAPSSARCGTSVSSPVACAARSWSSSSERPLA